MPPDQLKVEVSRPGPCRCTLAVSVGAEAVKAEREKVITELRKKARIEGFRPGKAPRRIIAGRFADTIKVETLKNSISESYQQALGQEGIQPINQPEVDKVNLADDDCLSYEAHVEVPPEIKLKRYTKFKVEKKLPAVTDDDVENTINGFREQNARFIPKEGPAQTGDYLLLDFAVLDNQGQIEKETERKNQLVMAGHEDPTALFSHSLVGLSEGGNQKIAIGFPDDYPEDSLKGNTINYLLNVRGIREKSLPEMDDHFVGQISRAANLDELKTVVRQNLEQRIKSRADQEVEEEIFRLIIEANPFEVPSSQVESVIHRHLENLKRRHPGQEFDEKELARISRPGAEFNVKRQYILKEIAEKENFTATPEDIEKKLEEYSLQLARPVEEIRGDFRSPEGTSYLRSIVQEEKVVQFLLENNHIKEVQD